MDKNRDKRVALVVGAGDEIGAAIMARLAAAGAATVGVEAADAAAIKACVAAALARHGRIDILVNNDGKVAGKPLSALAAADVDEALGAALATPFHFLREVVPGMQQQGYGRVVNVSELNYLGLPNQANAAAARAGLFGLTRAVALEAARDGVTVNTVVKGDIGNAEMGEEQQAKLAGGIPVKRLGTAEDVARAVCFFAADAAKYLTGQTLFVCGGKSAYFSMSM